MLAAVALGHCDLEQGTCVCYDDSYGSWGGADCSVKGGSKPVYRKAHGSTTRKRRAVVEQRARRRPRLCNKSKTNPPGSPWSAAKAQRTPQSVQTATKRGPRWDHGSRGAAAHNRYIITQINTSKPFKTINSYLKTRIAARPQTRVGIDTAELRAAILERESIVNAAWEQGGTGARRASARKGSGARIVHCASFLQSVRTMAEEAEQIFGEGRRNCPSLNFIDNCQHDRENWGTCDLGMGSTGQ